MKRTMPLAAVSALVLGSTLSLLAPAPVEAAAPVKVTGRASVLPGAVEPGTKGDSTDVAVSGNGRYLVFSSTSPLVPTDTDNRKDVYLKDLLTDGLERINVTTDGAPASQSSTAGAVSPDGRYVVFWSWATNLVPGDTNGKADVFVRDRKAQTTERVSVNSLEVQGNGASPTDQDGTMDISSDGRYVAFSSTSTNLGIDADTQSDIFVRDRAAGTTELVSVDSAEAASDGESYRPSMSADGRYVAFQSNATDLVAGDTNAAVDVFVRDRLNGGNTERASLHDNDAQSPTGGALPMIDDGGAKVVFASDSKLNAIDPNSTADVYVRTRTSGTTTVASVGTDGWAAGKSTDPAISGDGATVAYQSTSSTALAGANGWEHIYTRWNTTTTRATVSSANQVATGTSSGPALSADGKVVAWESTSPNLVTGDLGARDVFFRRWVSLGPFADATSFSKRQLLDFTGSQPTAPAASMAAAIGAGASPEHQIAALAHATAFAGKRPPLIRLYAAYFDRLPDQGGLAYWVGKLSKGMKLDQVSARFAGSSEFKTRYGNTTNAQFVKLVYGNVLDRQPDAAGLAYWVAKLDKGMSRGTVMTNFSESSEGKRVFQPQVTATLLSLGMIHQMPTGALLADLVAAAEGDSPEAAARVLLDSGEYAAAVS